MTLQPGTALGGVAILKVVARRPHGAIYEVAGPAAEPARMEEIELPPDFTPEARASLERAIAGLAGPARPPGLRLAFWHEHAYLAWNELEGSWLATRLRWSERPVNALELQQWVLRVVALVDDMLQQGNPLALEALRPESWFLTAQGELLLADPGLGRLVWGESEPVTELACLHAFGRLLESWTAGSTPLTTAYVWVIARCASERHEQNYPNFAALRKVLEERPTVMAGEGEFRTSKPPLEGFVIPRVAPRLMRVTPLVLAAVALVTLIGLGAWAWWTRPPTPRAGAGLTVLSGSALEVLEPTTGRTATRRELPGAARAAAASHGRIYLALPDSSQLLVLDDQTLLPLNVRLVTDGTASTLLVSNDDQWLYAQLPGHAELMVFRLPDKAAYLVPLPAGQVRIAPGPVAGQPGVLVVDPAASQVLTLELARGKALEQEALFVTGPAVADGRGGWWVASGPQVLNFDGHLRLRDEVRVPGPTRILTADLALWEGGVMCLDKPEQRARLEGIPVDAVRDSGGACWVATREPNRVVRLRADLSQVLLQRELEKPPTKLLWLR